MKTYHLLVPKPIRDTAVHKALIARIEGTGRKRPDTNLHPFTGCKAEEAFILPWEWSLGTAFVDPEQMEMIVQCVKLGADPHLVTITTDVVEFKDDETGYEGVILSTLGASWIDAIPTTYLLNHVEINERTEEVSRRHMLGDVALDYRERTVREGASS